MEDLLCGYLLYSSKLEDEVMELSLTGKTVREAPNGVLQSHNVQD